MAAARRRRHLHRHRRRDRQDLHLGRRRRRRHRARSGSPRPTTTARASATRPPPPRWSRRRCRRATIAAPTGTLQDTETLSIDPGKWTPAERDLHLPVAALPVGRDGAGRLRDRRLRPELHLERQRRRPRDGGARDRAPPLACSTVATSTFTSDVAGRALTLTSAPTIQGTVQVAQTVRAVPAVWTRADAQREVPVAALRRRRHGLRRHPGRERADLQDHRGRQGPRAGRPRGRDLAGPERERRQRRVDRRRSAAAGRRHPAAPSPAPRRARPTCRPRAAAGPTIRRSFAYAWMRCDSAGDRLRPIPGATRTNYVLPGGRRRLDGDRRGDRDQHRGLDRRRCGADRVIAAVLPAGGDGRPGHRDAAGPRRRCR